MLAEITESFVNQISKLPFLREVERIEREDIAERRRTAVTALKSIPETFDGKLAAANAEVEQGKAALDKLRAECKEAEKSLVKAERARLCLSLDRTAAREKAVSFLRSTAPAFLNQFISWLLAQDQQTRMETRTNIALRMDGTINRLVADVHSTLPSVDERRAAIRKALERAEQMKLEDIDPAEVEREIQTLRMAVNGVNISRTETTGVLLFPERSREHYDRYGDKNEPKRLEPPATISW
jgi:hypothetical protein